MPGLKYRWATFADPKISIKRAGDRRSRLLTPAMSDMPGAPGAVGLHTTQMAGSIAPGEDLSCAPDDESVIKVGRDVLDKLERVGAIDQVVQDIPLGARQFFHDVLTGPAHGFIGAMYAFGEQQNQYSVTECHGDDEVTIGRLDHSGVYE